MISQWPKTSGSFRFLDDWGPGDIAFEATGKTRETLFIAAADAMMNAMVEDLGAIQPEEQIEFAVEHASFDMLLFKFLNELLFLKDARKLLTRIKNVQFSRRPGRLTARARGYGEILDPGRHSLLTDVKAVTLHRYRVSKGSGMWKATVVLDV